MELNELKLYFIMLVFFYLNFITFAFSMLITDEAKEKKGY